jgi:WD40 repeat protein
VAGAPSQVAVLLAEVHWTAARILEHVEPPPFGIDSRLLLGLEELSGERTLGDLGVQDEAELTLVKTRSPLALALSCTGAAEIWHCGSGERLRAWHCHAPSAVTSAVFSSDYALLLTGSEDCTAKIWNCDTGACVRALRGHARGVASAEFSPDDALVLTGSRDGTVKVWRGDTGVCLQTLRGQAPGLTGGVISANFSPNCALILTKSRIGGGVAAELWSRDTGERLHLFGGDREDDVVSATFSPDGASILTISHVDAFGIAATLWSCETGRCLRCFGDAVSAAFSPDGASVLTICWDGTAKLWPRDAGERPKTFGRPPLLDDENLSITSAVLSPDGTFLLTWSATDEDERAAKLWSCVSGEYLRQFRGHEREVTSAAFSPDGTAVASGSLDGTARLWRRDTGECLKVFGNHGNAPGVVATYFSSDGASILTIAHDGSEELWSCGTGERIGTLHAASGGRSPWSTWTQ